MQGSVAPFRGDISSLKHPRLHLSCLDPHDSLQKGRDCRDLPVKLMPNTSSILTCCSRTGCVHPSPQDGSLERLCCTTLI